MSTQLPASFVEYFKSLPIPWLVGDAISQADATAQGTCIDLQVALVKDATRAHMPNKAPADALPLIGGDRQLEQGPGETDANFRVRLATAWDDWARAGTAVELLTQLHWAGFTGAVIAQQNGLLYTLSTAPTAGVDPTPLLVITNASANAPMVGTPPWWTVSSDNAHTSQFVVLFPSGGGIFSSTGTATFTGTEDGVTVPWPTVTWSYPFLDTAYLMMPGAVYAAEPVTVSLDPTTKTPTSVRVSSSATFVGTVECIAWTAGANPFADVHAADFSRLQRIINRWRPAKALCRGIFIADRLPVWGYPTTTVWGQAGLKWGDSSSVFYGVNNGV